ncbi:TetR/AcrR family transcriptional regulator [Amylibacter sp. IMCC11727]|uniref:TetR/AcrR family transcriptional regulator n=1 Tax=Amylibacter sp. IMCC11727 TaxID=3039851 RepID=UPI00244E0B48|nr:TetR/AcrR family transcriptional regulator [Amylibacter sp. IMCC11727]WGI22092.1 TetR/AcrR family transcriptional regulator [Amylibacter sp. IMCC11727]
MARPVAKDYGTKRRLILDRAAQLFADEGFDRTSVSRVALACEISKANVYHYYGSKDEILFDILDAYLSGLRDGIFALQTTLTHVTAQDRFSATITKILLDYQGMDHEHRLQTTVLNHLPPDQQKILLGYQRELVHLMSRLIRDVEPVVFENDPAKLRATTMSVFGMLNWFYMWKPDATGKDRRDYAAHISRLCSGGFAGL